MKPNVNGQIEATWQGTGDRARQIMREYRGLLSGYAPVPDLEKKSRKARAAVKLPAEMRQLLERYKRGNPGKVEPIAYITAGGSAATRSVSQFAELPPEDDLVILALTETIASASHVEARSQVLLIRRIGKR
jgi:hypothetical protein